MIPLHLHVRNFMCYGESGTSLVLEGIHVACLCGDNGHGKSAILDALTWALWGRARAKTDDELVHLGKTEMEVELELAIGDERYRVIRKRALKGKRGATALEFQVRSDDGYHPVTGNSVHETQRKISDTLRMEYETFINSALLLQGRADEFTTKSPAERKKVLADVLSLGLYDDLEGRAREKARAAEMARRELAAAIAEIDREVQGRPEHEAARDRVAGSLGAVERDLAEQQALLDRLRAAKHALDLKTRRKDELAAQRQREERQLAELEAQLGADLAGLTKHQALLDDRQAIENGYARLLAARARNDELGHQASALLDLQKRQSALEQAIAKARAELEKHASGKAAVAAEAKTKVARRSAIEKDLADVQQLLGRLAELEARRDALREEGHTCQNEIALLNEKNERLKKEMGLVKEKLDVLGREGAACPVCERPLDQGGKQNLEEKFRAEGAQLGEEYRGNSARAKEVERKIRGTQAELSGIEQRLAERDPLRRQAGALERGLDEIEEAVRAREAAEQALGEIQERLGRGEYAISEQGALKAVREKVAALGYDATAHERVRRELGALAPYEARQAGLRAAETGAVLLREQLERGRAAMEGRRQALNDLAGRLDALVAEIAADSRVLADLAETQDRVDALARQGRDLRLQLGRAEQLIQTCLYLEEQRREKLAAQQLAAEEKGIYDDLTVAFSKKGIQAMIIDAALPEIEYESNLLLGRLTDNRMYLKLETQREAKSVDGVIETLDIKISDELGARQYELYSGGEAFRVNFALRIALSKLLARRAGARLQTLIVDEGFGTQDTSGRERLVEAINAISTDFDCILVITHIQELKDAFPVRIDVLKGADGSQILVHG